MQNKIPRIAASSYSNTAPLIWSFLYGSQHGSVELIMDNAPARSAQLLEQGRVDAALVPVIASQFLDDVLLVPGVCVGARKRVRSVCLVTNGEELNDVRSVALDTSSRTSVVLTKIIFREFLGFEPEWLDAAPNIDAMLTDADAALLIGDPALAISELGMRNAESRHRPPTNLPAETDPKSQIPSLRSFDLAELWQDHTGLGFVFAMWMTRHQKPNIDLAGARDEGIGHIDAIVENYRRDIGISAEEMKTYLSDNISYEVDETMQAGLNLYLDLAAKHKFTHDRRPLRFIEA